MCKLKILIVGVNKEHSLERVYMKHLKNQGIDVNLFDARSYIDSYRTTTVNKILFKMGFHRIYDKIGINLIKYIESFDPSVVLVFKGMELNTFTIRRIKEKNLLLINYNPDHPFVFSSSGSGNKNVIKNGKNYDLHLTYGKIIANQISTEWNKPCEIVPFGFELDGAVFKKIVSCTKINRVCFIGHPDKNRAKTINFLIENDIPITVYGKNWSKYLKKWKDHDAEIYDEPLYGEIYWRRLRSYRVQLNILRKHNKHTHNMRSFEVPAVGGIMLSNSPSDHQLYFEKNRSYFEYDSYQNLLEMCNKLLKMSPTKIEKIRNNARDCTIQNSYSYENRAKLLITIINKYLAECKQS